MNSDVLSSTEKFWNTIHRDAILVFQLGILLWIQQVIQTVGCRTELNLQANCLFCLDEDVLERDLLQGEYQNSTLVLLL